MPNVTLVWTLPNKRESGRPLNPADIMGVEIAASVDNTTFTVMEVLPPTSTEVTLTELEPGDWFFRGVVVDKDGRRSAPVTITQTVPDTSPPQGLPNFSATVS